MKEGNLIVTSISSIHLCTLTWSLKPRDVQNTLLKTSDNFPLTEHNLQAPLLAQLLLELGYLFRHFVLSWHLLCTCYLLAILTTFLFIRQGKLAPASQKTHTLAPVRKLFLLISTYLSRNDLPRPSMDPQLLEHRPPIPSLVRHPEDFPSLLLPLSHPSGLVILIQLSVLRKGLRILSSPASLVRRARSQREILHKYK